MVSLRPDFICPPHRNEVATKAGETKIEGRSEEFRALLGCASYGELADQVVIDETVEFGVVVAGVVEVPALRTVESRVNVVQPARFESEFDGSEEGDVVSHIALHTRPRHLPVLAGTESQAGSHLDEVGVPSGPLRPLRQPHTVRRNQFR